MYELSAGTKKGQKWPLSRGGRYQRFVYIPLKFEKETNKQNKTKSDNNKKQQLAEAVVFHYNTNEYYADDFTD